MHGVWRPPNQEEVLCDLGTDCSDCGPYVGGPYTPSWDSNGTQGPVEYLRSREVPMFARATASKPSFMFPFTDHERDRDVSYYMNMTGSIEGGIARIFEEVLKGRCIGPDGRRRVVLDVGANFGYFSVYAALFGCRVIAWEPVPLFRAYVNWALAINNVTHLVDLRPYVASSTRGQVMKMAVPTRGADTWGTASVDGANNNPQRVGEWVTTTSERVDDVVSPSDHVLLMKLDVEGFEHEVLAGSSALFDRGLENLVMEYSPYIAERLNDRPRERKYLGMLEELLRRSYRIGLLDDNISKPFKVPGSKVSVMKEVTPTNLMYDVKDVETGCLKNAPVETLRVYPSWNYWFSWGCLQWRPMWSHPKSFRSTFFHNTNIWAHKRSLVPPGEPAPDFQTSWPVGILALEEDARTNFFSKVHIHTGVGMANCIMVEPMNQVVNHCKCRDAKVCGEEEKLVLQLLKDGKMPHRYELPVFTGTQQ